MTVVNYATGEIVDFDRGAAERRAERITLRLDAIADNYRAVLPMIREAIEKRDDIALGYRSPGDYVSDRFGHSLAGLGIEVRRAVVGELTQAGLSTRAIAPVVGASVGTVHNDREVFRAEHLDQTPEPEAEGEAAKGSGQTAGAGEDQASAPDTADPAPVEPPQGEATPAPSASRPAAPAVATVVGIDGKTYQRPTPKAPRSGEQQNAEENSRTLASTLLFLLAFQHPNQRDNARDEWTHGNLAVPPTNRAYVTPDHMRQAAHGLAALADEWENPHA